MNLNAFNRNVLREQFEDQGDYGGGAQLEDDFSQQGEDYSGSGSEQQGQGDQQQQRQAAPAFDPATITQAVIAGLAPALQQRQAPAPQMTDEEFRQRTQYFAVTPEITRDLFGDGDDMLTAKRQAILQQLIDGSAKHALAVSGLMSQTKYKELEDRLAPISQAQQAREKGEFVSSITKLAPALRGKENIIDLAITSLTQQGYQSQGAAADQQAIIKTAEALAKQFNPNFSLKQAPNGGGGRAGMPKMGGSVNGAGGQSGGPGQRQKLTPAAALYARKPVGR